VQKLIPVLLEGIWLSGETRRGSIPAAVSDRGATASAASVVQQLIGVADLGNQFRVTAALLAFGRGGGVDELAREHEQRIEVNQLGERDRLADAILSFGLKRDALANRLMIQD
jgi:hypothetical protein